MAMLEAIRKRAAAGDWGAYGIVSWVHLDDAVAATVAALEHGRPGEVYNIVDDRPASINEWTVRGREGAGRTSRPLPVPLFLVRLMMPYVAAVVDHCAPGEQRQGQERAGLGAPISEHRRRAARGGVDPGEL